MKGLWEWLRLNASLFPNSTDRLSDVDQSILNAFKHKAMWFKPLSFFLPFVQRLLEENLTPMCACCPVPHGAA